MSSVDLWLVLSSLSGDEVVVWCGNESVADECWFGRKDLETCFMQVSTTLYDRVLLASRLRSGRSVARQPAMMLAPHSMVDQVDMLTAFQKKSSVWTRPST